MGIQITGTFKPANSGKFALIDPMDIAGASTTLINDDGTITETFPDGIVTTTTITGNTIVEASSSPSNKTITTTVNNDGSITEVIT